MAEESNLYASGNNSKTKLLYLRRLIYRTTMVSLDKNNIVNFSNGAEKYLYGRVNPYFVPIIRVSNHSFKTIIARNNPNEKIDAQGFVADAFDHMAQWYKTKARGARISMSDPYLTELKAYKGYIDPRRAYQEYYETYSNSIINSIRAEQREIENFHDFANVIKSYIGALGKTFAFTMPAYVKSRMCPMNVSGLVVEIADLSCSDDQVKIRQFVESPNWNFFVSVANQHGFMIDANVPWRLVADIRSDGMQQFMRENSISSADSFLGLKMKTVAPDYFEVFKRQMLSIYNQVKRVKYVKRSYCGNVSATSRAHNEPGKSSYRSSLVYSKNYKDVESLESTFNDLDFFKLFVLMRFAEEESSFSQDDQNRMLKQLISHYQSFGVFDAIMKFERILNKTFDYVGSASYYKEQQRKSLDKTKKQSEVVSTTESPSLASSFSSTGGGGY